MLFGNLPPRSEQVHGIAWDPMVWRNLSRIPAPAPIKDKRGLCVYPGETRTITLNPSRSNGLNQTYTSRKRSLSRNLKFCTAKQIGLLFTCPVRERAEFGRLK